MTAAHIQNDKSLTVTFMTGETARRFTVWFRKRFGRDVYCHNEARVMLVDHADWIDRAAIEIRRNKGVQSVRVDWHNG